MAVQLDSFELIEVAAVRANIGRLTRDRMPKVLEQLRRHAASEVVPFQVNAARNQLFASLSLLSEGLIESRALLSDSLCPTCERYDWYLPVTADHDRRDRLARYQVLYEFEQQRGFRGTFMQFYNTNIKVDNSRKVFANLGTSEKTVLPVWASIDHPSGSLFSLLTRPTCRICLLVLHLLSPLPIKSFLRWAGTQSTSILTSFKYRLQYRGNATISVHRLLPTSRKWQEVGLFEVWRDTYQQGLVWQSSSLSEQRMFNRSWVQTTGIDYALVNRWLRRCHGRHKNCTSATPNDTKDMVIRLIDVVDYCLVKETLASQYFALSYVWGGVRSLKATKANIATLEKKGSLKSQSIQLPRTIRDAMIFVRKLNYRYLWVDKLCIVQDDREEKHSQISNMHEIYSGAFATIVQHSGHDANGGLPGIRKGSRSVIATKAHIDQFIMMAKTNLTMPDVLKSSVHSTRGWTLQEVLLSNRCLHFFDKHLMFVCQEEYAQDWSITRDDEDPSDSSRIANLELTRVSPEVLQRLSPFSIARAMDDIRDTTKLSLDWLRKFAWSCHFAIYGRIVTDYTSRHFSVESDVLHAFYGLAGGISRLNGAQFHYGMPSNAFDLALLWMTTGVGEKRKMSLNETIPSWSWAAWQGQTAYNIYDLLGDSSRPFEINSFVRVFHIVEKDRSVSVQRYRYPYDFITKEEKCSPYLIARSNAFEPYTHLRNKRTRAWPEGCLHFWAEECAMDQFSVDSYRIFGNGPSEASSLPLLRMRSSNKRCGTLALPTKAYENPEDPSGPEYWLILMSETPSKLGHWMIGPEGGLKRHNGYIVDYRMNFFDGEKYRRCWYFNVLLVRRIGLYVERIAFGQVHMLAWLETKRRRRYIRMI